MDDLRINERLSIPGKQLCMRSVRAGGPGGQNVNKLATKVSVTFDAAGCTALAEEVRERLRVQAKNRLDRKGRLRVVCQRYRSRERNLQECRRLLAELIRRAMRKPKKRKRTRPPLWTKEKKRRDKVHRSRKKDLRRPPAQWD